jgi:hypothetical protein
VLVLGTVVTAVMITRPVAARTDSGDRHPTQQQTRFVTDLPYTAIANGAGPVERDSANGGTGADDGGPIAIGGRPYARGLGVHAISQVRVYPSGQYGRFLAEIGITGFAGGTGAAADTGVPAGSVRFKVVGDGRTLYGSGLVRGGEPARAVEVDISGVQRLDLVVGDNRDGTDGDLAAWADARLECHP